MPDDSHPIDLHDEQRGERPWGARESWTFDRSVISYIQRAATTGIYDIRGGGAKRRVPHFDDLLFLGASVSRYPLEGYRERCDTDVVLGDRFATQPLELKIPITIAGMSFGALSAPAKEALGRGATAMGTATTTGDGGMTEEEQIVEVRQAPLRAEPTDVVDALARGALDLGDRVAVERRRLAQVPAVEVH
jgi:hypothetical protein